MAAKAGMEMAMANAVRFGLVTLIGDLFIFIGKVFICVLTTLICYLIITRAPYY